jgi:hypothetical protein
MSDVGPPQDGDILSRFTFLKDESLSDELKKFLVEKSMEARNVVWTRQMEERKWRWSTPLAIALTGAITVAVNFLFDYWRANHTQSIQERVGELDAQRKAEAAERELEYRIVERELSDNDKAEGDRARVLLFLVRAGVLNRLDAGELRAMAQASLDKLKNEGDEEPVSIGVPALGASQGVIDDTFRGLARAAAKLSVSDTSVERFKDLKDLIKSLPADDFMASHVPPITNDRTSNRVAEEQRNVSLRAFLYAASREASNDYHLVISDVPDGSSGVYMTAIVSGLPDANSPYFAKLKSPREILKGFFSRHLPSAGYTHYNPPIPLEIEGSLFFNPIFVGRPIGPAKLRAKTAWEIRPITKLVFEP